MLLYDVFYPLSLDFDSSIPLPAKPQKYTLAICKNGERTKWVFAGKGKKWIKVSLETEIPNSQERLLVCKKAVNLTNEKQCLD